MKQKTQEDIRAGLSDVLNRFGIDKEAAKRAREELASRIAPGPQEAEETEEGERFFVHFYRHFGMTDLPIETVLIPTLKTNEQSAYRHLYYLAYNTVPRCNWCQVSIPDIARACNMSVGTARTSLKNLRESSCIKIIAEPTRHEAPVYRVYLPCEMPQFKEFKLYDNQGKEIEVLSGVFFLRNQVRPTDFRPLNFRGLKSVGLNTRPLIFEGLDQLRGTKFEGLSSNFRGLNFGGLAEDASNNSGLDDSENGKIPLNGLNGLGEISLSSNLIELFYTGIGQKKISKTKREKGNSVLQELQEGNFSEEDIQFAIKWTLTPGNTKEKVHDFSIISHTIGQALAAREAGQQAADAAREEAARVSATEEERRRLKGEIEEMRAKLLEADLVDLRGQAEREIAQTDGIKKQFINEPLIVAKENEILRRKDETLIK